MTIEAVRKMRERRSEGVTGGGREGGLRREPDKIRKNNYAHAY